MVKIIWVMKVIIRQQQQRHRGTDFHGVARGRQHVDINILTHNHMHTILELVDIEAIPFVLEGVGKGANEHTVCRGSGLSISCVSLP